MRKSWICTLCLVGVLLASLSLQAQQPPIAPKAPVLSTADFLATLQTPQVASPTTEPPVRWATCTVVQCRANCECGPKCTSVCLSTTSCGCTCRSSNGQPCAV